MGIRVMIALSNRLFADGVKGFLDSEKDIEVVDVLKAGASCDKTVRAAKPDVMLVDFLTLYNGFDSTLPNGSTRFILFDTNCGEDNITGAVISKGISGVIPSNSSSTALKRAVRAVAGGELFLGKKVGEGLYQRRIATDERPAVAGTAPRRRSRKRP